jgi:hypothetical protein
MTDLQLGHHELTINDARALTDQIKTNVEETWQLVKKAYERRAWTALGYTSWDAYCDQEFGTTRLRLPREERAQVVGSLREAGLSIRAIASATGADKNTVQSDLARMYEIHTPEDSGANQAEDDPVPSVIELDGMTEHHQPQQQPTPAERQKDFHNRFGNAVIKLDESVARLERYGGIEEFATSTSQLAKHRAHLLGLRNRLDDLLAKLSEGATS